MVDFKKKLKAVSAVKAERPTDIYDQLDRKTGTGPLRDIQKNILTEWYDCRRANKDLIIKLHTGEGKTLIGLLILQSIINMREGPCAFISPNIHLVEQVISEAQKFGIPYCTIKDDEFGLPTDFTDGSKILITNVNKVFNGKSIFGLNKNFVKVGCIVLDDSHACIEAIKAAFTIRIKRETQLYKDLLLLFEDDLKEQGEGSFLDLQLGDYDTIEQIPYWAWIDKKSQILQCLSKYTEELFLKFSWPLLKDQIENCQAFITGKGLEILPNYCPIDMFGSFNKANRRILMSATTQDDSFFIKGLNFGIESIKKPLTCPTKTWSGEKMIIIPSLIDESLNRELVMTKFAKPHEKFSFGCFAITPSYKRADIYGKLGSVVTTKDTISNAIMNVKMGSYEQTIVLVNRYDGVDLPDETCRILIIDSMPFCDSLSDRYELICRENSDIMNLKLSQKIEQGLGRSVRGEKDYSAIILIGPDLVRFVRSSNTSKYFSPQTKKQIEIGLEIADMASDDIKIDEPAFKVVMSLLKQMLKRDDGWKEYYKEQMDSIVIDDHSSSVYELLNLEHLAELSNYRNDNENACLYIQNILDKYVSNDSERGWYLQLMAKYKYYDSKLESNKLQKSAFECNNQLLKPLSGISYKKIGFKSANQLANIKKWLLQFENYEELKLATDDILDNFSFGKSAKIFEKSVQEIGLMLGFESQRPDFEIKKGPDNLWCGVSNIFFMIECKNEVAESRELINKHEAAQMNSHCGWFEEMYGTTAKVKRIMIIPTKKLSYESNFTHDIDILTKKKLNILKSAIRSYIKEMKEYKLVDITEDKLLEFITASKLTIDDLLNLYTDKPEKYRK